MSDAALGWPLADVAAAVARITDAAAFDASQHGVLREARGPVQRLGLALDHRDATAAWVRAEQLDALFVHRPWSLDLGHLIDVGVVFSHAPFDERLTTGANPRLADALGLVDVHTFGERDGRPLAMLGTVVRCTVAEMVARVVAEFGGMEDEIAGDGRAVTHVAVAGAMTEAFVREAAALGVDLYVTGQLRAPARAAVADAGMHVIAVGHERAERWGLRALSHALAAALPGLECVAAGVLPDESPPGAPDEAAAAR